jgi:hypothetical protein
MFGFINRSTFANGEAKKARAFVCSKPFLAGLIKGALSMMVGQSKLEPFLVGLTGEPSLEVVQNKLGCL